jgi:hypothetical protein
LARDPVFFHELLIDEREFVRQIVELADVVVVEVEVLRQLLDEELRPPVAPKTDARSNWSATS